MAGDIVNQPGGNGAETLRVLDAVLAEYGIAPARMRIEAASGGFSGAQVWRLGDGAGEYALKAWPPGQPAYLPLLEIHQHMRELREAGIGAVPEVRKNRAGLTVTRVEGLEWELAMWRPGEADACEIRAGRPAVRPERLSAAMRLLSWVHAVWRPNSIRHDVCFAIRHQWERLGAWKQEELERLKQPGRNQCGDAGLAARPGWRSLAGAAVQCFLDRRERAMRRLEPWLARRVTMHLCLGDIWSDHILFTGDQATGLVDFGGVRPDHPAQDLARLLGSYCRGDAQLRSMGLSSYHPGSAELEELAVLLDETGVIVGIGNWLRWLVLEGRKFADPGRTQERLKMLVERATGSASGVV
jgi:aminoglycoside phosphotransferase (APT) family kinase protein